MTVKQLTFYVLIDVVARFSRTTISKK